MILLPRMSWRGDATMTEDRKPETPGLAEVSAKLIDEAEAAAGPSPASISDDLLVALGR